MGAPKTGEHAAPSSAEPTTKKFSWRDVARHCTRTDCWVIVAGEVYDVTDWVDRHPGGAEVLMLCAGRECTEMMQSYHPFTDKPWKVLKDYHVGTCVDSEFPTYETDTGFWKEVKTEVGRYFSDNKIDSKDWRPGAWRMVPVMAGALACYLVMHDVMDVGFSLPVKVLTGALYGIFQALPLLHVMHDSCHCAFSHAASAWEWAGRFTLDWFAGCSMLSWQHQHVVGHHIYTNVYDADPDVPPAGDPRRVVKEQPYSWVYRYQHIYLPILYGILGLKMRYDDIASVWLSGRDGPVRVNYFDPVWQRVFAVKGSWILWRFILPVALFGQPVWEMLAVAIAAELATGWWLAFNFQVSHISDVADWPQIKDGTRELDQEWARSQVVTGVNYYANPFGDFLCGALNYQIEHHLFPCVSQYHYPAIAPIVKRVAEKHGMRYNYFPSYTAAITAHLNHLYELGLKGEAAELHLE